MGTVTMIHVGFAETDITPKLGSQSPGGMQARRLNEVHDPLKAVAMVIKGEKATVALVGIDALFITEETTARAREAIARETHIPGANVLIGASHTHGGGPIASCFESEADPQYLELVAARVAEAVGSAFRSLHAAQVGDGIGQEPSISFNRRFLMRDGKQVTHPGKGNVNMVKPAGPIDPDVGVLAARSSDGELLGLFVNFACHLTVMGGNGFTADYVCHLRETLRKHYEKPQLPVGFLLGAAGDVTQVDNRRPGREFGDEWARMFGLALAAETVQTIERMTWRTDAVVGAVQKFVDIPIRDASEAGCQTPALGLGSGSIVEKIYARERELVAQERAKRAVIPCEVQAIRVGELGIVTNGAEFFCQLGVDIKAASPLPRTWVVSLANGWIGYVPTPSAYYAGGYEPRTARSAKMAPWAGQSLVEASLAALQGVHLAKEGARTNS
jgi:neutral ceramidase